MDISRTEGEGRSRKETGLSGHHASIDGGGRFQWPKVSADSYILPLWEGKFVPGRDANWKTFLDGETMTWSESFSMNFFALNKKQYSLVYILKHPFNQEVHFDTKDDIQFQLDHEFPSVNPDRTYGFRLYVADNDPVHIAGLYKSVLEEKPEIVTLAQKAKANPDIEKLYGAPHIYLWNNDLLTPEEIHWPQWRASLKSPLYPWISQLLAQYTEDGSKEFDTVFKQISGQDPLYEQATITNKEGEKVKGFLGRGRKLNPTLALPLVKQRVQSIMQDGIPYRSWFVDADATGEIYDDYSPEHPTTQEQDMKARLERMAYIANEKKMVVGSETGNDFASGVIAFAHGLETPVIKWGDPDMRVNKSSEYYVGGYYSKQGGIPERYRKQVPVKELYKRIYLNPAYSLPLYKLVYNDSVITTHHWEWGTFKIKDAVVERMMTEFLYNVPPLYHLDQQQWAKDKKAIAAYFEGMVAVSSAGRHPSDDRLPHSYAGPACAKHGVRQRLDGNRELFRRRLPR
ncbi:glycoside hydrolase [Paenibacillus sp. MZ04-78.2]|nr:glycoside hydrolase [Paenibacillus sp. MZ04-78.2]MCP3772320.1 glycoside hydrolase [Paenibacillus sp. MZ04-78.2]